MDLSFLRINCFLHDVIEGKMKEVRGVGRRRTQLLDDLRNKRFWELKRKQKSEKDGKFINRT